MNGTIRVAKTKALISFAVTAKLICAFVFAYADCWFSHAAAQKVSLCGNLKRIMYPNVKNLKDLMYIHLYMILDKQL